MVEREAVAFLNLRLRTNTTQDIYASEIAAALGGLPLALEHAAAYVEQTRQPLRTYLRLIESDRRELLSRSNPGMTNYRLSVAATFRLTIVRLGILLAIYCRLLHVSHRSLSRVAVLSIC
jgi:hypothetical protein